MGGNKFYFTNKNAASDCLTQSTGTQWSEIQRHVQKGLSRPRKSKTPPKKEVAISDNTALYNPVIRSIACSYDPFNTASVPIDSTVRGLLDYYIYYYHPTIWTYEPAGLRSKPYAFKDSVIRIVDTALEDDLAMYALLSAAASRVRHVDALPFQLPTAKEHDFTQQALHLMQERINKNTVFTKTAIERLVSCITFLGSAESYRDNYTASKTHFEAALKLLEPSGGIMRVQDRNLQGQLLMADLFLSCVNLQPCKCGFDYDPGPASVLALSEEELPPGEDPNLGIILLGRAGKFMPSTLRDIVLQILESYSVKSRLNTQSMLADRCFETTHWVTKRNMAIRNRLLALRTFDTRVHALRAALIMWTLLSMNITGRVKTVKIMARQLKLILGDISPSEWSGVDDIRFWIMLIGFQCADEHSRIYSWFAHKLLGLYGQESRLIRAHLGASGLLQALEIFQQGFLFHAPLQRARTLELVELLMCCDGSMAD